jgi:hypothetical protein
MPGQRKRNMPRVDAQLTSISGCNMLWHRVAVSCRCVVSLHRVAVSCRSVFSLCRVAVFCHYVVSLCRVDVSSRCIVSQCLFAVSCHYVVSLRPVAVSCRSVVSCVWSTEMQEFQTCGLRAATGPPCHFTQLLPHSYSYYRCGPAQPLRFFFWM